LGSSRMRLTTRASIAVLIVCACAFVVAREWRAGHADRAGARTLEFLEEAAGFAIPPGAHEMQLRDDAETDPLRPMYAEACFRLPKEQVLSIVRERSLSVVPKDMPHPCDRQSFSGPCANNGNRGELYEITGYGPTGWPRSVVADPELGLVWVCVAYPDAVRP